MKTFKSLSEATNTVKKMKVGKKKNIDASIVKNKGKFDAVIDGDVLDTFNSSPDAEKAINDFMKLIGK